MKSLCFFKDCTSPLLLLSAPLSPPPTSSAPGLLTNLWTVPFHFWCFDWKKSCKRCFNVSSASNVSHKLRPNSRYVCVCLCVWLANNKLSLLHCVHTLQRDCRCPPAALREKKTKHVTNICCRSWGTCGRRADLSCERLHVSSSALWLTLLMHDLVPLSVGSKQAAAAVCRVSEDKTTSCNKPGDVKSWSYECHCV